MIKQQEALMKGRKTEEVEVRTERVGEKRREKRKTSKEGLTAYRQSP